VIILCAHSRQEIARLRTIHLYFSVTFTYTTFPIYLHNLLRLRTRKILYFKWTVFPTLYTCMIYNIHYSFRNKILIWKKIVTNRGKPDLLYDGFQHREAKSSRTYINMFHHLVHSCSQVGVDLKIAVLHLNFEIVVHEAV
jgi:hypothetical protein